MRGGRNADGPRTVRCEATLGPETELASRLRLEAAYEGLFGDRSRENLGVVTVGLAF